jgi:hypothetical protein
MYFMSLQQYKPVLRHLFRIDHMRKKYRKRPPAMMLCLAIPMMPYLHIKIELNPHEAPNYTRHFIEQQTALIGPALITERNNA